MNKENKLGMGLGALLSTSNKNLNKGIQKLNISQIQPNPIQPRKNFNERELKELVMSMFFDVNILFTFLSKKEPNPKSINTYKNSE